MTISTHEELAACKAAFKAREAAVQLLLESRTNEKQFNKANLAWYKFPKSLREAVENQLPIPFPQEG